MKIKEANNKKEAVIMELAMVISRPVYNKYTDSHADY